MEFKAEEGKMKKYSFREVADVSCQTDQSTSTSSSSSTTGYQQTAQSSASASSRTTSSSCPHPNRTQWEKTTSKEGGTLTSGSSSASASGASTPGEGTQPASSSPAPSVTSSSQASSGSGENKIPGPAGVKPAEIENYFGDKKQGLTIPPGLTQKARAASTTGVVGEGKKQVRNNLPAPTAQATNTNSTSSTTSATPASTPAPAIAAAPTPASNAASSSSSASSNGSSNSKADGPSWSDESCKLRLVINRFSQLEETMCSPPKSIEGVSWKIMVMPKQHMVQKKQQKCMGFFLQCAPERAYSDQWSVHAIADMRMISYKPNVPHFARRTTHTYTSKENDWGYSCFMTWADIIDEGQGYIRDDTVVLEIAVKAEPAKNMMTHEDFLDKIEKWIVLADMQMKKGNIDLALEANQSAMKFCKGKDDVCYQRLETQRETFVNAKLFESIERIEKGPVVSTDTTHGKPTSLRQALTGAQKSLNGKMTAKGGKKTRAVVTVQHMKKKKPYDQNGTTQQRTNTGTTVKDMVEKRKSSKSDDASKKDLTKSKEELEREEQSDEEETSEKIGSEDQSDEYEEDDDEYCEEYPEHAEECQITEEEVEVQNQGMFLTGNESDMEMANSDEEEELIRQAEYQKAGHVMKKALHYDENEPRGNLHYAGHTEEQVFVTDRMVQTDFDDEPLQDLFEGDPELMLMEEDILVENVFKLDELDDNQANIASSTYFKKLGVDAIPDDGLEKVIGVESPGAYSQVFTKEIFESLPSIVRSLENEEESNPTISNAERMIRTWLDVEGALVRSLDPEGVLAKLSAADRQKLLEELNFKINPLIQTMDMEFRETVHCARSFLMSTRNALDESHKVAAECDDMKKVFEEKLLNNSFAPKVTAKRSGETAPIKTSPTPPTANGLMKNTVNGRPTVIAKRSIKPVVVDVEQSEEMRGRVSDLLRCVDATPNGQAFRQLNTTMQPMIAAIAGNNRKIQKLFADLLGDNGVIVKHIKDLVTAQSIKLAEMQKAVSVGRENAATAAENKDKMDKAIQESAKLLAAETERHVKTQKEVKDLKNQLKKAESKSTKEENRATTLQVQLNDIDEKAKALRKELETLKKKSAEERAKTKKEKERDTQTIRQQSIEISERESERDKARKETEEEKRGKDKAEKEKKAVAGQLAAMTDRARSAEVAVLESRWTIASEELKKRKDAAQAGYTETEGLTNRVRQVSDRDMMRKSLAEWKAALDKCDLQIKSTKAEYDHAIEQVKSGSKTLVQTIDIKLPAVDALPKLVKPPPVQVVAPSTIPPPIAPPTPAAGVIGQQRTPSARPTATDAAPGSACSTPSRSRAQRVPSPVKPVAEAPSSLWSWNTIGNIGELRESSHSALDPFQRDIWAANGNGNGSIGSDYLRSSSATMNNGLSAAPGSNTSQFLRMNSQPGTQSNQQASMNQNSYASQQSQMQNSQRMQQQQQQQPRSFGDMWNASNMQQNSNSQDYGNQRMMHNGAGDLTNGQGYGSWHNSTNSPIGNQLRGNSTPQSNNHHMFQPHSFYSEGM